MTGDGDLSAEKAASPRWLAGNSPRRPRREWSEPFLLMSAPDGEPCTVPTCKSGTMTRWQVEVIGYNGHEDPVPDGPKFTVCAPHLTAQMNRYLGGR